MVELIAIIHEKCYNKYDGIAVIVFWFDKGYMKIYDIGVIL